MERKKKKDVKRSTQNLIPYVKMFSNGVALLPNQRYSATIKVEDINYQIANDEKREDIFSYWMQLLNSLTPEEGMDITIHNHSLDEEQYRDDVLIKYREDDCDKYRGEINNMLINGMKTGSNNIISDKYISFAIKEETLDRLPFSRAENDARF